MKHLIVLAFFFAVVTGCNSNSDSDSGNGLLQSDATANIIAIDGYEIPSEADLVLAWITPDTGEDVFITEGGEISNGRLALQPSDQMLSGAVNENYGISTAVVFVFPDGAAPAAGRYNNIPNIENAIGISDAYSIIYRSADFVRPDWWDDFDWWADLFNYGYSCARNIEVEEDFDRFEPIDCSDFRITIGDLNEIELIGFNWT